MTQKKNNILPTYCFFLLNDHHLLFLSTWIGAMVHPQWWNSPWTKTWMMEVNRQPAFCVSFYTYDERDRSPENNRLSLVAAPSIQRSGVKLMRAWQAAVIYIFQQEEPDFLTVEVPVTEIAEREAIQRIGFREWRGDPGISTLYVCNVGEITPVF